MRRSLVVLASVGVAAVLVAAVSPALASAAPARSASGFASVDQPGPELSPSGEALAASLRCLGDLEGSTVDPVLLLSSTAANPPENFDWNYEPALTEQGIPWCTSTSPDNNLADEQVRGEYVVYALREMAERSDRRVAVIGHSQGGGVIRWALRFWPDTRELVSDVIGLAPANEGTLVANGICAPGCAPAIRQNTQGSKFMAALNSGQRTFAGIDYTVAYTQPDDILVPQPFASTLPSDGGRVSNVLLQSICPGHVADHITAGTLDPVSWAIALDALAHDGPADPARIDRGVCLQPYMPGTTAATAATGLARYSAAVGEGIALYPKTLAEPELAGYTAGRD
jgi:pimeloyl-ACP methyl ester carboxylesterase